MRFSLLLLLFFGWGWVVRLFAVVVIFTKVYYVSVQGVLDRGFFRIIHFTSSKHYGVSSLFTYLRAQLDVIVLPGGF